MTVLHDRGLWGTIVDTATIALNILMGMSGPYERTISTMAGASTLERSPVGRPRSDYSELLILRSALHLYGEAGYSGFNFSKIAIMAGVGKSSIYARWTQKDKLLEDAFHRLIPVPTPTGGTLWSILTHWAATRVEMYVGPHASAVRRIFVENSMPDSTLSAVYDYLYREPVTCLRCRLWEFKDVNIIPRDHSVTRLVDAIEGSVLMRGFSIPNENVPCFLTEIPEYVESLVSDQLSLIGKVHAPLVRVVNS